MSGVHDYTLTITGLTPLLMHSTAWLVNEPEDKPTGARAQAWELEHYKELAYTNETGHLIVPAINLKGCIVNACRFMTKKPKGAMSWAPIVTAALVINEDVDLGIGLDKLTPKGLVVSLQPGKKNGGRGLRTRPQVLPPWGGQTTLVSVDDRLTEDVLDELIDAAGRLVGLCDGRSLGFGRFSVKLG